jgi:membrane-bound lytic murein transglycosylase A
MGDDVLTLADADFADLPGWADDKLAEAVPAFVASCAKLAELDDDARIGSGPFAGRAGEWRSACAAAARVPESDDAAARAFFEKEFAPYSARGRNGAEGKMTGYHVQTLRASRKRGGRYQFPLLSRPADLVSIQLSDFIEDGRSRRIWGRIDSKTGALVPYPTSAELRVEGIDDDDVLLWVDNPADAIGIEIEGSGIAKLEDGSVVMVAFAGKNGRRSGRLGSVSRAARKLDKDHGPGPWLQADLDRYWEIIDQKTSVVFFKIESRAGAIGTQDVILTPRRSLAVDRAVIALSTPVWVDTRAPSAAGGKHTAWRRLLIAQDTGGHILGTIRGDIFWGDDREAIAIARRVNGPGRMWLLLPRGLSVPTAN